jgi:hypothetical protein
MDESLNYLNFNKDLMLYYLIHFTMQTLHLLERSAEAFLCQVQHYECLAEPESEHHHITPITTETTKY